MEPCDKRNASQLSADDVDPMSRTIKKKNLIN